MKRIGLLLSCTPNYGGTFQYCLNMLDALASLSIDKYKIVVAYINPVWVPYLKPYSSLEVHVLDLIKIINPPCDLWIFPSQESWDFQREIPVLSSIHDLMHRYESRFEEVSANGLYEQREEQYTQICAWSKGVLVDSETGRQQAHESYAIPFEKIYVLPYIPTRYIYQSSTVPDFEDKYLLPSKYIFYPAHLWPHKNHVHLVTAMAVLKDELADIQLVLAGSFKDGLDPIYECARALNVEDRVLFMGYVPDEDMPELYRRARALVMPTFFGPTNIPPLEAFVLGCPVAISNIYGIPHQVGDAALLFDPHSLDEITDCLRRLWTDDKLCVELIAKGRKQAALWGPKQFENKLSEIIYQLL